MIHISIFVTDVSETRHAPYLLSRLPRHAGIGGDGAARGARTPLTPAAVRPVLTTYADIAAASYRDSHQTGIILRAAIATLIAAHTERNLAAARQA